MSKTSALPWTAQRETKKTLKLSTRRGDQDSATYLVLANGEPTAFVITRNDNELEPGGNPELAWVVREGDDDVVHETGRKRDALAWISRFLSRP